MTKLVVDEAFRVRLEDCGEFAQFCDEKGNVLGYFLPAGIFERTVSRQSATKN
jgi:hypothetical protein